MNIRVIFKELVILDATSIGETCEKIEKRNPDIKIDRAFVDS